ncbi:MAG: DUF2950 domain-containing protein [Silvibacterium sp.]|nr:DUF2950 domain-containing protein [Silvibacterium sp.]
MKARGHRKYLAGLALLAGVLAWSPSSAPAQEAPPQGAAAAASKAAEPAKAASPSGGAELFDSPQAAVDALLKAAGDYDTAELAKIFGPSGKEIYDSGDAVQDKNRAADFVARAKEKMEISVDPKTGRRAVVIVGNEDWPMPVPLAKTGSKWYFDTKAGKQELLYRRIGSNELDAIQICRGYVDAQEEYALKPRQGYDVNQYAQRIVSTPGTQDGLAWKNADGTWGGPIGENIADAIGQGYSSREQPYHGYFFKILKGQGPDAPLGRLDYVIKGLMIGGFALVAAPAQYRVTGVMTFIVSNDGVVYQKDLGPTTLEQFKKMELFNPDKTWTPVEDEDNGQNAAASKPAAEM